MPTDVNWVHTNPNTQFVATAADAPLHGKSASGNVWTILEQLYVYLARIARELISA